MSTTTEKLALFKYDPSTDGAQTFNIKQAMNDNWDKIDDAVKDIDTTLQNNDPKKWGLGIVLANTQGTVITDFDVILPTGFYYVSAGAANRPIQGATFAIVIARSTDDITVIAGQTDGLLAVRRYNSAWGPWEYVNPPMDVGYEYRTTERYQGKPVYVKLVDFGALPNATTKIVNFAIENNAQLLECKGFIVGGGILPYSYPGSSAGTANVYINKSAGYFSVFVSIDEDLSGNSAYFILKYTKTTD